MTTAYDFDWEGVFGREFDKALERDANSRFPKEDWLKAGRGSGEDEDWWRRNGGGLAAAFGYWLETQPDTDVWITPDGRPAIELHTPITLGGVKVEMYIDLILRMGTALVITDYKSGSRTPHSYQQLGLYATGVELTFGQQYRPAYGGFFMCRGVGKDEEKQFTLDPVPLDEYRHSREWYERQFGMFDRAKREEVFIANPGDHCRRCGVNFACLVAGGAEAGNYDRR